jgi:hypothetical protein
MTKEQVRAKMADFVDGKDRSLRAAGEIEVALDELWGEEEPFASLASALAQYRPGGGEFLYDEATMVKMMKAALEGLERKVP